MCTFYEFIPRFRLQCVQLKKHSTQKYYEHVLQSTILPYFGKMRLDEVTRGIIGTYISYCVDRRLQNNTINGHLSVLSQIFKCAEVNDVLAESPPIKRLPEEKREEVKFLEAHQVRRLILAAHPNPTIQTMIAFAAATGLRVGEIRALEIKHVDWANHAVRVCQSFCGRHLERGTVKGHDLRSVGLHGLSQKWLDRIRHLMAHNDKYLFEGNLAGEPMDYRAVHDFGIIPVAKRSGLYSPKFGFHVLRHTFASHLVRDGVPLAVVQKLMGHTDIAVTMRYAHLAPDAGHKEQSRLTSLFFEPPALAVAEGGEGTQQLGLALGA